MKDFRVIGKVFRTDDSGSREVGASDAVVSGESWSSVKEAWLRDMRKLFHDGPTDTVEFMCSVTEVPHG